MPAEAAEGVATEALIGSAVVAEVHLQGGRVTGREPERDLIGMPGPDDGEGVARH